MEAKKQKTARIFTLAISTDKDGNLITSDFVTNLLNEYKNVHEIYAIFHDRDDTKKPHWHFLVMCKNPRNFSTIGNIFNVESNFVESVINKRKMFRYLTHLDDPDKAQYLPEEVLTNSKPYSLVVGSFEVTNKELFEQIANFGPSAIYQFLDIVEPQRLATIQRLVGNEFQRKQQATIERLSNDLQFTNNQLASLKEDISNTYNLLVEVKSDFEKSLSYLAKEGIPQLTQAFTISFQSNIDKITNAISSLKYDPHFNKRF